MSNSVEKAGNSTSNEVHAPKNNLASQVAAAAKAQAAAGKFHLKTVLTNSLFLSYFLAIQAAQSLLNQAKAAAQALKNKKP